MFKIFIAILTVISIFGCKSRNIKINQSIIENYFHDGEQPLKSLKIQPNGEVVENIDYNKNALYGVIAINGREVTRGKKNAVSLSSLDGKQYVKTYFMAAGKFDCIEKNLSLRIENLTDKELTVILYQSVMQTSLK